MIRQSIGSKPIGISSVVSNIEQVLLTFISRFSQHYVVFDRNDALYQRESSISNQDYTLIQCVVFCFGVEGAIEAPGAAKAGQPLCDSHEIKKMLKNETSLS